MILHFCTAEAWADAQRAGEYTADTLASEGFIHCSSAAQVHIPATIRARGRTDLVLLEIDESRLPEPPRWEPGDGVDTENLFPHVYGPLPVHAVIAVHPYPPEPDGSFAPPKGLM
jgi:uncharacterized protein (DUF952 family)